jgi:Cu(I)/Ag(I) efflux system membrane fusion protein
MWTGERSVVYVRERPDQPVFTMREVTLGPRMEDVFVVSAGLEPGEEVVTNGTFTVDAAAQLQGKRSMMNKSVAGAGTGRQASGVFAPEVISLSEGFQEGFRKVIPPYLKMKDAFVKGQASDVAVAAGQTLLVMDAMEGPREGDRAESYLAESMSMLKAIADSQDLENQRMYFVRLNEHLVALAGNLSSAEEPLYIQHCPMANENQGAVWLSAEKEIRNPYYGDAMLTCGSILDSVQ